MDDLERRITELERVTRNGYSPLALKIRLDNIERKANDLDVDVKAGFQKVDKRFDGITGQFWRGLMFLLSAMGVAAAIVSVIVR
jgi:hypothetical protein